MADNNEIDGHFLIPPNKSTVFYNILELDSWYDKKDKSCFDSGSENITLPNDNHK